MSSKTSSKIYTKGGDLGKTGLIGGRRVSKAEFRFQVNGTIDELNCFLGVVAAQLSDRLKETSLERPTSSTRVKISPDVQNEIEFAQKLLTDIQMRLFDIGSQLACDDAAMSKSLPLPHESDIVVLERAIDQMTLRLAPLKNFILPGGTLAAAHAHVARAVCRRAERAAVRLSLKVTVEPIILKYLNRLSDFLFVLARSCNHWEQTPEPIWQATQR